MSYVYLEPTHDLKKISGRLEHWQDEFPDLGVLVLVAESSRHQVPGLQASLNELGIPLLGAVFPEIHHDGKFYQQGFLLICLQTKCDFYRIIEFSESQIEMDRATHLLTEEIGEQIAGDMRSTLFMIFDALVPKIGSCLESIYLKLAQSVHYVGANAGSETFQSIPCLFDNQMFVKNALLAIHLKPHEGAVLEHSYQVPDQVIAATSTEGNRIVSIDWKPAFEVYRDKIKDIYGVEIDRDNFYDYSVHFPFGIMRADDEILVRIPVALEEDGSLFCVGEVPENAVLTLLEAPERDELNCSRMLAQRLEEAPSSMLVFYCAGRRLHLGEEAAVDELCELRKAVSAEHIYGALSLGEIGSSQLGGYPLFQHASLVCMRI